MKLVKRTNVNEGIVSIPPLEMLSEVKKRATARGFDPYEYAMALSFISRSDRQGGNGMYLVSTAVSLQHNLIEELDGNDRMRLRTTDYLIGKIEKFPFVEVTLMMGETMYTSHGYRYKTEQRKWELGFEFNGSESITMRSRFPIKQPIDLNHPCSPPFNLDVKEYGARIVRGPHYGVELLVGDTRAERVARSVFESIHRCADQIYDGVSQLVPLRRGV